MKLVLHTVVECNHYTIDYSVVHSKLISSVCALHHYVRVVLKALFLR